MALTTFHGERYLPALLESLQGQDLLPHELVVGDDSADSASANLIERFARSAPFPVRLHRNADPLGAASNFLATAERCTGDWIAFCDQDDVWLPSKLDRCLDAARRSGSALVIHSSRVVDKDLRPTASRLLSMRRSYVTAALEGDPRQPAYGHAMLFDRALVDIGRAEERPRSRGADLPMMHDEYVYFVAFVMRGIARVSDHLVLYRLHEGNVTGPPTGLGGRARTVSAQMHGDALMAYGMLCEEYAEYWRDRASRSTQVGEVADACWAGAQYFADYAALWKRRSAVCTGHRTARAAEVFRLFVSHAYRPRSRGGFGMLGAVRDLQLLTQSAARRA